MLPAKVEKMMSPKLNQLNILVVRDYFKAHEERQVNAAKCSKEVAVVQKEGAGDAVDISILGLVI